MRSSIIILLQITYFYFFQLHAQAPPCAFDILMQQDTLNAKLYLNNQQYIRQMFPPAIKSKKSSSRSITPPLAGYIIPTVIHIIHKPAHSIGQGANISNTQIRQQFEQLNQALATNNGNGGTSNIQLCLATIKPDNSTFSGIIRHSSNLVPNMGWQGFDPIMNTFGFDPEKYLNIYIVEGILNEDLTPSTIQGIGIPRRFSPLAGIVMGYKYFGSFTTCTTGCNLDSAATGKVLIHEAGHYFGLLHTFQDGCANVNTLPCSQQGDFCCDTRPENGPHYFCASDTNTCTEPNDANDPIFNYMAYRLTCAKEFTPDQDKLMQATLQGNYESLIDPQNIIATGATHCGYQTALFSVALNSLCDTGTFVFTALDTARTEYKWLITNTQTNSIVLNTTTYTPVLAWFGSGIGQYTVALTTMQGTQSITLTRSAYINVQNCKTKIKSPYGNWYFGKYAGMNFSSTSPVIDDNARIGYLGINPTINTFGNTISQSTPNGRLLFYGGINNVVGNIQDRLIFYNKIHQKIPFSDSVHGNFGNFTGNISIPRPSSSDKQFYIVSSTSTHQTGLPPNKSVGLYYSVLDTSLDGGKGAIISTGAFKYNKVIPPPIGYSQCVYPNNTAFIATEVLLPIPQCNGNDYWLLTCAVEPVGNFLYGISRKVFVFQVLSNGIFFNHVDSFNFNFYANQGGVSSPDGKWLYIGGNLFSFDKSTGKVKHIQTLIPGSDGSTDNAVFSPNSKILYYYNNAKNVIVQKDLTFNGNLRPTNNINIIASNPSLQLAPNGKIYIGIYNQNFLAVINNPNGYNTLSKPNLCGFTYKGFYSKQNGKGGVYKDGLPNIIHAQVEDSLVPEIIAIRTACFNVKLTTNICCDNNYDWNFGDGNTSTGIETTHAYTAKGIYTITLTRLHNGNTLTLTKNIKIGLDSTDILSGSFSVCDLNKLANYNVMYPKDNLTYKWKAINGTISSSNGLESIDIKWLTSGTKSIRLIAKSYEGCQDSITKPITIKPQVTNNTISMKNQYCGTDTIFSTTPSSGTWYWQKRKYGTTQWDELYTQINLIYIPTNTNEIMEYARMVVVNDCYYQSNIIRVVPFSAKNTINPNTSLCGIVSNGTNLDTINGLIYQWQRSTDSIIWSNVTGQNTHSINQNTSLGSFYFYRRRVSLGNTCFNFSNVIYAGGNKVRNNIADISACYSLLNTQFFKFTLYNQQDTNLAYKWYINYSGTWIGTNQLNPTLNATYLNGYTNAYVRCRITTGCGYIYTTSATVNVITNLDTILQQPNKINTLNQGNNLNIVSKITRPTLKQYQWQSSHNNGISWSDLNAQNKDTLIIPKVSECQNKRTYRLKITNLCGNVYFSDTSNVKINNITPSLQDYFMKDNWADIGAEPNLSTNNFVKSADLWVRRNPDLKKPANLLEDSVCVDTSNYIHYTVRNSGTETAKNAKLYLYWTWGATGESWPLHWTENTTNRHWNPKLNNFYYKGGPVNRTAILLPNIAPNDSIRQYFKWSPPKPIWFYPWSKDDTVWHNRANICLLARINTCDEENFGLTYKEQEDVFYNVKQNNNIVTRNLWVKYLNAPPGTQSKKINIGNTTGNIDAGTIFVRNTNATTTPIKLCIKTSNLSYFTIANMYIEIDETLKTAWINGGSQHTGLVHIQDNIYKVTNTNICLTSIIASPFMESQIRVYFGYVNPEIHFIDNGTTNYIDIQQYQNETNLIGECSFLIKDNPFTPIPFSAPMQKEETDINNINSKILQSITAYPNPTGNTISVLWNAPNKNPYVLSVYDMMGKLVYRTTLNNNTEGTYQVIVPLQNQSNGIYTIKVSSIEFNATTKVVLIK